MNDKAIEEIIDNMAEFTAEEISKSDEAREKIKLSETLNKFNSMLRSRAFERKCKEQGKKYGVSSKFIKNAYATKILNSVGEGAGVSIETIGEAFNYLIRFVSYLIQKVMDIAVSVLTKLVNIITLRKPVEGGIA